MHNGALSRGSTLSATSIYMTYSCSSSQIILFCVISQIWQLSHTATMVNTEIFWNIDQRLRADISEDRLVWRQFLYRATDRLVDTSKFLCSRWLIIHDVSRTSIKFTWLQSPFILPVWISLTHSQAEYLAWIQILAKPTHQYPQDLFWSLLVNKWPYPQLLKANIEVAAHL